MRHQPDFHERYVPLPVPVLIRALVVSLAACSASSAPTGSGLGSPSSAAFAGRTPDGSVVELTIASGMIASVAPASTGEVWLWPAIVDSHVHLAYYPVGDRLAARGIGAVVDLAAPEGTLAAAQPLTVIASGPMITRPAGYPLNAWGDNGYGIGCGELACVTAAIDRLAAAGAKVIKLPLDATGLPPPFVEPAIAHAHAKGLRVAVHALTDDAARRGATAGADVLAHTPVEPLASDTVTAWRGRAVISTLAAFGAPVAADNLKQLRAHGLTVLYGTDLGNLRVDGPSEQEMTGLRLAGLDDAAITAAMTTAPIDYWKLPLGVKQGDEATFLVLDLDPRTDASALLRPRSIVHRGRVIK